MAPTTVGIIGAGLAGPVIAVLLKMQGYDPIIFERLDAPSEGGIGLGLRRNGLEVLQRIPGLLDSLVGRVIDYWCFSSVLPEDKGLFAEVDVSKWRTDGKAGPGMLSVRRSALQRTLVDAASRADVPIRWGHHLSRLEQRENDVQLTFANGAQEVVSFVVGCDGLHSDTRKALLGEQPADFTGLVQVGGYAPLPERLTAKSVALSLFGDGMHMLAFPVDEQTLGWAITTREPEAKETWRAMNTAAVQEFKRTSPAAQWDFGGGEIIRTATTIIKYGLYDRPELPTWHKGRVILIGDAAHPTSPHLGQGANLSFEDAGMLADLLAAQCSPTEQPTTEVLDRVFTEFEKVRIPRTAEMVRKARAQGETRVVHGVQACIERNNWYRKMLADETLMRQRFGATRRVFLHSLSNLVTCSPSVVRP